MHFNENPPSPLSSTHPNKNNQGDSRKTGYTHGIIGAIGVVVGAAITVAGNYYATYHAVGQNMVQFSENRNFLKFREVVEHGQHEPAKQQLLYHIERRDKLDKLKWDIVRQLIEFEEYGVVNIIARKGTGKSMLAKEAVRELQAHPAVADGSHLLLYLDASRGLQRLLQNAPFKMELKGETETAAVRALFSCLERYQTEKGCKVRIVLDSPGGIHDNEAMEALVRECKSIRDNSKWGAFYVISSPEDGDGTDKFDALCKRILGENTGRYGVYRNDVCIDFHLTESEKQAMIEKAKRKFALTLTPMEEDKLKAFQGEIGEFESMIEGVRKSKN